MTGLVIDIFRIILVIVVLSGMAVLLVSLHHLMVDRRALDDKDKGDFRRELMDNDTVISEHSIFYKFFERKPVPQKHRRQNHPAP